MQGDADSKIHMDLSGIYKQVQGYMCQQIAGYWYTLKVPSIVLRPKVLSCLLQFFSQHELREKKMYIVWI